MTEAYGIDKGRIVGMYRDGPTHGFLYDGTVWTTLDFPGAEDTMAWGIDGDSIVGVYRDSVKYRSFLYDFVRDTWTTFDVPGAQNTLGIRHRWR